MIEACNSAIVRVGFGLSLAADFHSQIIDFRDSSHGGIQLVWRGVDTFLGEMLIHGSLLSDPATLDDNDVEESDFVIPKASGSHLYTYKKLSFRYAQLRWAANGVSTGTVDIYAQGKKV